MTSPMPIARKEKAAPDRIAPEWLGAEARVYLSPDTRHGNRPARSGRRFQIVALLASFVSGLVLARIIHERFCCNRNFRPARGNGLEARDGDGGRRRHVGRHGETNEPFRVSTEVTPCLDPLAA